MIIKNKNLLIITQAVDKNDSNLGFFCEWLEEFAHQVDNLYVIANRVGAYNLPKNVTVVSLGKEDGAGRIMRLFGFWKYLVNFLPRAQGVLVHMCPEYVIYGGWIARLFHKKIGLWYLHRSMTWKLKLSSLLVNNIFTAHSDGIPLKSDKVVVTGHGINLDMFYFDKKEESADNLRLLTVGRIAESKNLLFLVKFAIILQQKLDKPVEFIIIGGPYLTEDIKYLETIKQYIQEQKEEEVVDFIGTIAHKDLGEYYKKADIFLNASRTGGVDKAVLEAAASGVPVITSNPAFKNLLPAECLFMDGDMRDLEKKVMNYKNIDTEKISHIIGENHNLTNTVKKILSVIIG